MGRGGKIIITLASAVGCFMVFLQVWECVEVFAGKAVLSQCLRDSGFETAALDICYWDTHVAKRLAAGRPVVCNSNPLDLTSSSGFGPLRCT